MNFELTDESIVNSQGTTLYRIRALVHIPAPHQGVANYDHYAVEPGDLGGFVEHIDNLNGKSNAWIADNAQVWGKAYVSNSARVVGDSKVHGHTRITGCAVVANQAEVSDKALVSDRAFVLGTSQVMGSSEISGDAVVRDHAIVKASRVLSCAIVRSFAEITSSEIKDSSTIGGHARVIESTIAGTSAVNQDAVVYCSRIYSNSSIGLGGRVAFCTVLGVRDICTPVYRYDPIGIFGMTYPVTITDEFLTAGCQTHAFQEWRDMTPHQIAAMDGERASDFYPGLISIMEGALSVRKQRPYQGVLPEELRPLFETPVLSEEEPEVDVDSTEWECD